MRILKTGTTAPTLLGYPYYPTTKDPNNQVAGYFLNQTRYEDTAVFRIPAFSNDTGVDADTSFQNTTRDFFAACRSAKKSKLIIDVSGYGGGNTLLPNDLFKRLFPDIEPYGASRLRGNPAAEIFGSTYGAVPDIVLAISSNDSRNDATFKQTAVNTDIQNFTGWIEGDIPYYPPNANNGDEFTALAILPANSSLYTQARNGFLPYGYDGRHEEPVPFTAQNIVLLTDGIYASACSILAEFLTRQAGNNTIVVGGRPRYTQIQAIGDTKGYQAYPFSDLARQSSFVLDNTISPYIPESVLLSINDVLPGINSLPLGSRSALSHDGNNLHGSIPEGVNDVPIQFIFEPANCRLLYTPVTVISPLALWLQTADVAWKGGKCSFVSVDSVVGNNGSSTGGNNGTSLNAASGVGVKGMWVISVAVVAIMMCL